MQLQNVGKDDEEKLPDSSTAAAALALGDSTNIDSNLRRLKGVPPFVDRLRHKPIDTDIEGTYLYANQCGLVYQATVECGSFGIGDDDLCLYSEFSAGSISNSTENGAVPIAGTDAYYVPSGSEFDEDNVCVFSGTFRKSSAFNYDDEGNILFLPLPLASSNGCQVTTKNFKLVVKGTLSENEDSRKQIELDFSDDSGVSYYTDDKECSLSYVAFKLDDNEGRSLAVVDKDEKSIILGHRALQLQQSLSLCDTSGW